MREIAFQVLSDQQGQLRARAEQEDLSISASSLEDLRHEAREALIARFGEAHGTVRLRLLPLQTPRCWRPQPIDWRPAAAIPTAAAAQA
ncbi:MAG: hypothetical protein RLZZ624_444 [Cyanobacteriota bacterium]|jgi:hypothetical protein